MSKEVRPTRVRFVESITMKTRPGIQFKEVTEEEFQLRLTTLGIIVSEHSGGDKATVIPFGNVRWVMTEGEINEKKSEDAAPEPKKGGSPRKRGG